MKTNNFKVKCVKGSKGCFTKGKIYLIINGTIRNDNGTTVGYNFDNTDNDMNVNEMNEFFVAQFELVEEPVSIAKTLAIPIQVEVDNVSDSGVVTLLINDQPVKVSININSMIKKESKVIKNKWTDWIRDSYVSHHNGNHHVIPFVYKTNNKKVIVKMNEYRASATCHKNDLSNFDLHKGIELCIARIEVKKAEAKLQESELDLQYYKAGLEGLLNSL